MDGLCAVLAMAATCRMAMGACDVAETCDGSAVTCPASDAPDEPRYELSILQERVLLLAARVRASCIEKMATFCGAEAVSASLPVPPKLGEALLSNLPPPPSEAEDFAQWAQGLVELSEQRAREERNQGLQEGEARGKAEAILVVLKTRGVAVPPDIERRIAACTDPAMLSRWLERAVTAESAAQVVEPEGVS